MKTARVLVVVAALALVTGTESAELFSFSIPSGNLACDSVSRLSPFSVTNTSAVPWYITRASFLALPSPDGLSDLLVAAQLDSGGALLGYLHVRYRFDPTQWAEAFAPDAIEVAPGRQVQLWTYCHDFGTGAAFNAYLYVWAWK